MAVLVAVVNYHCSVLITYCLFKSFLLNISLVISESKHSFFSLNRQYYLDIDVKSFHKNVASVY